jgi:hypothetical protein
MSAPASIYEESDFQESFDGLELADEASILQAGVGKFRIPGGLASATLVTPKGPARLNLPSPVPTLTQFRTLEQAVQANAAALRAANAEIQRLRRELVARRRTDAGQSSNGLLLTLLSQRHMRDDLEDHTHVNPPAGQAVVSQDRGIASLLPLLLLTQGGLGQTGSGGPSQGGTESMLPLLLILFAMGR